jgi:hypothetical protein
MTGVLLEVLDDLKKYPFTEWEKERKKSEREGQKAL